MRSTSISSYISMTLGSTRWLFLSIQVLILKTGVSLVLATVADLKRMNDKRNIGVTTVLKDRAKILPIISFARGILDSEARDSTIGLCRDRFFNLFYILFYILYFLHNLSILCTFFFRLRIPRIVYQIISNRSYRGRVRT